MKSKREREEACSICGHYHDYEGGEPCKVCGHVLAACSTARPQESVMPTTVIPGFLYLGSYDTASRQELLKAMQITEILNTVPSCQPLFKNTFTYHTASCAPPDFDECFGFLDGANAGGKRVLVYCMTGVSRGPAIVIGYLMRLRGWRLAEAFKWVKDKRPAVNLSATDAQRLVELERRLTGACSVPLGFAALSVPGAFPLPQQQQQQLQQSPQHQQQQGFEAGGQQQQAAAAGTPPAIFGGPQVHWSGGGAAGGGGQFVFGGGAPAAARPDNEMES